MSVYDIAQMEEMDDASGMVREAAFDALVGLAYKHGGESALLGDSIELATKAYRKSLIGNAFPHFWMEVPLIGTPGFDLHVYYDRKQVSPNDSFAPNDGFGMQGLFDWYFGKEKGGVGVGFAHDLRGGQIQTGIYVNFNHNPLHDMPGFFASIGAQDHLSCTEMLLSRLPSAWLPWYVGLFPERLESGVRVGSFVTTGRQREYASDQTALAADLASVGFEAFDDAMLEHICALAALPFELELQLDATYEGTGSTLSVDLVLKAKSADSMHGTFLSGTPYANACNMLESWHAADERWHHIAGASLSRLVPLGQKNGRAALALTSSPAFIKTKWTNTLIQPAKVYMDCSTKLLVRRSNDPTQGR